MVNMKGDAMPLFHLNQKLTQGKWERFFSEVYFARFVFCSTERFVFGDQGLTGAQSALLSGLCSRLVLVRDALAWGFRPTVEPEPCSCSLLHGGGRMVL